MTALRGRLTCLQTSFLSEHWQATFFQSHTIKFTIQSAGASPLYSKRFKLQPAGDPKGRWPQVTHTLPVKPTSNAPSMSSGKSGTESSSSSSEDSDNDWSENSDFVIASPNILTDSEDNGCSPSQHILEMKKQMADHDVVPNSTSGSDEEEEEVVVEEVEQSADVESGTSSAISADAIMSKFTEMSCQFAEMMEQQKKLQLMAMKNLLELHCLSIRHLRRKLENCRLHSR